MGVEWTSRARATAGPPEESLEELAELAASAGALVLDRVLQARPGPEAATLIGRGKVEELAAAARSRDADMVVFDHDLTPTQQRNLEKAIGTKVLDRTQLILDIFASRARTREGRLQIELAQLNYRLPRLSGHGVEMSRLGGGIGTRGPGETQLETDRRVIRQKIKKTRERVEEVRARRETAARARDQRLLPAVAIVGYTNAGKSTLLNALVGEEAALVEDKLFATLDPTTRRVRLSEGQTVIVSDTVGFIHKLPHQLVEAFRATLEEVTRADILLEVVDLADPRAHEHRRTVQTVLDELGAGHKPRIVALNKADRAEASIEAQASVVGRADRYVVRVSALTGQGIEKMQEQMSAALAELWLEVRLILPYSAGELLARVRERGAVTFEYRDEDVLVEGRVPPSLVDSLRSEAASWQRALTSRE